jgi:hypothetical protein
MFVEYGNNLFDGAFQIARDQTPQKMDKTYVRQGNQFENNLFDAVFRVAGKRVNSKPRRSLTKQNRHVCRRMPIRVLFCMCKCVIYVHIYNILFFFFVIILYLLLFFFSPSSLTIFSSMVTIHVFIQQNWWDDVLRAAEQEKE